MIKAIQNFLLVMAVIVWWFGLFLGCAKLWATHPAEQTITEAEYMAVMEGYGK